MCREHGISSAAFCKQEVKSSINFKVASEVSWGILCHVTIVAAQLTCGPHTAFIMKKPIILSGQRLRLFPYKRLALVLAIRASILAYDSLTCRRARAG